MTRPRLLALSAALAVVTFSYISISLGRDPAPEPKALGTTAAPPLSYPSARRGAQVDDYHGTKVADPYRWLEDTDSSETRAWIAAENRLTESYLSEIPSREPIRQRLTELWNFERFGLPSKEGPRYFYTRNDGLQNQNVLLVADSLDAKPRVLLDPNQLSADGTIALSSSAVSYDGKHLAYGLATAGSDWNEWKVRDVETGQDLPDHLRWVKFSGASWTPDGRGFYYSRYAEPQPGQTLTGTNYFQKVYFHKLGTPQSEDQLVYERPDQKEWGFGAEATEDGRYLVFAVWQGSRRENQLFYRDLQQPDSKVVELLTGFDADYNFLGNDGSTFYLLTDLDAPQRRIVAIDVAHPERSNWRDIVPQSDQTLERASLVGDQFFCSYLKDATSQVRVFDLSGKHLRDVSLPGLGTVSGFSGKRRDSETFYGFGAFTAPTTIYRYDLKTGESTVFRRPKIDFDSDRYETVQRFAPSRDGTKVPLFITAKKGLKRDGANPTLLYAYGGFGISLTPAFSARAAAWMEMGGVFVVANLRGGNEYGVGWHEAGRKERKQNVFDDFYGAAEYLIAERYTQSKKLAIAGGSNGGLLVGAAITQRPALFGAALPAVGVMDMLRFHKFTIGWGWTSEFGSADVPEEFPALFRYSPLHNLRSGESYPATLVLTADHDDRVVPGHSFKFAAALQAAQGGPAPVLIRIETKAGHGAGIPVSKKIAETADELAFLTRALDFQPRLPASEAANEPERPSP